MHQRIRETNLGNGKGTRGGEEKREPADDGKDPHGRSLPDEEYPVVPCQGQLQGNERQGCGKLLFLSQLPEIRQSSQVPHRNDERTTRSAWMGQTPIPTGKGLRPGTPPAIEDDRARKGPTTIQDPP